LKFFHTLLKRSEIILDIHRENLGLSIMLANKTYGILMMVYTTPPPQIPYSIHRIVFYSKHVSQASSCLLLQLATTQLGTIDRDIILKIFALPIGPKSAGSFLKRG
jgi:hypothetical protein